ncbi:hypothetical protein [Streptomyces sp. YIM S03343]
MTHGTAPDPAAAATPQPVPAGPGVLVHPAADRRLAVAQWLLSTLPADKRARARADWQEHGVALLRLGTLFSAVRLPAPLVTAAAGGRPSPDELDAFLAEVLDGPVVCDPRHQRYYALVPASMPRTWTAAVDEWRAQDVDALGRDTYLGIPRPDRTREAKMRDPFWAVPMESLASLCQPLAVARLVAAGAHQLADAPATA